jgi:excisionase family DNA binding protein
MDKINRFLDELAKDCSPRFNGEAYLSDKEASLALHVSRRTMQAYRTQGILPYYKLGGKVLYRESDIEKLLQENYLKPLVIPKRRWY